MRQTKQPAVGGSKRWLRDAARVTGCFIVKMKLCFECLMHCRARIWERRAKWCKMACPSLPGNLLSGAPGCQEQQTSKHHDLSIWGSGRALFTDRKPATKDRAALAYTIAQKSSPCFIDGHLGMQSGVRRSKTQRVAHTHQILQNRPGVIASMAPQRCQSSVSSTLIGAGCNSNCHVHHAAAPCGLSRRSIARHLRHLPHS